VDVADSGEEDVGDTEGADVDFEHVAGVADVVDFGVDDDVIEPVIVDVDPYGAFRCILDR
jgi:hypothetical protein